MKGRQSRYVTGGESFAEIARRPGGTVVMLCLNPGLEEALREASKSLKSAFSRSGRNAGCQPERRKGRLLVAGREPPRICLWRCSEGGRGQKPEKRICLAAPPRDKISSPDTG